MSAMNPLVIAGANELADRVADYAARSTQLESVDRWQNSGDSLPSGDVVLIVADEDQRVEFARAAIRGGARTISLPLSSFDDDLLSALDQGNLRQVSPLHGNPTLASLPTDCRNGRVGRRYGIFAAHRLPRNHADYVDEALRDLIVFVGSLIDTPLTSVRATSAAFGGQSADAWFLLARFADDTIGTIEVSAVLPQAEDPTGQLLVEVTGSDAVLRAEPERQSVLVSGHGPARRYAWYSDPAWSLLDYCTTLKRDDRSEEQVALARLLTAISEAARVDSAVMVTT